MLILTGANSAVGLRSMPARYLFLDEVDGYPGDVEGEGDPILLAERRSATFQRRKILLVSTPKTKGLSRIEREYGQSDQRRYFVPCPHCHEHQTLELQNLRWPEGRPREAEYACAALRQPDRRAAQDLDAGARRVAAHRRGRWPHRRVPPLQPLQPGRLVQLGRCRRDARARPADVGLVLDQQFARPHHGPGRTAHRHALLEGVVDRVMQLRLADRPLPGSRPRDRHRCPPRSCPYVPAIQPELFSSVFLMLGLAWSAVIGAECIGIESGIGRMIIWAQFFSQTGRMALVTIVIVVYAMISFAIVKRARVFAWMPEQAHGALGR